MFDLVAINLMFAALFIIGMYMIYSDMNKRKMTKEERDVTHFFGIGFIIFNGTRWLALSGLLTWLLR